MNKGMKNFAFWLLLILIFTSLYLSYNKQAVYDIKNISYTNLINLAQTGRINEITIIESENLAEGKYQTDAGLEKNFRCYLPLIDDKLIDSLIKNNVEIKAKPEAKPGFWSSVFFNYGPIILFVLLLWFIFYRNMGAGGRGAFSFGKSRAKLFTSNLPKVTFKDVAGCEESKKELEEIIDFLRDPKKFQKLGGRIPKGVLVVGPPGTGKTLLARAVAGEAGVPFFSISGSDFVEMFVGVGASRVRDLFENGKKHAPCIIFIDEIDAVGRQRGAGLGGGHDEREQTLNALLVEMDGFETNEGVILIAATNRPDVLDPALLRPGRFDRNVIVDRPDKKGRFGIFKVHTRKIPLESNVSLEVLARGTPGFSGADIENLVNEAALQAARKNKEMVTMLELEEAKDKVLMGPERKSMVINDKEKKNTAYHEAGHALVAELIPGQDPLHKITIIPRGRALGVTVQLPIDDRHSYSKDFLLGNISILLGGRAAEELIFGQLTTGAGNDIEKATKMARKMVCEWGMSSKIGPVTFGKNEQHPFLGKELGMNKDHSEKTATSIDCEITKIITEQFDRAKNILNENIDILHELSNNLIENEILDGEDVRAIIRGEDIKDRIVENTGEGSKTLSIARTNDTNKITFTFSDGLYNGQEKEPYTEAKTALVEASKLIEKEYEKYVGDKAKNIRVEIIGYTDSIGEQVANKELSLKRAEIAKKIIVESTNIPAEYFVPIGKGENEPIGDNTKSAGRKKNRRIKIIFVISTKKKPPAPNKNIGKKLDEVIGEISD